MQCLFSLLFIILLPNIALAKKPQDLGVTMLATAGMVLVLGGIVWLISQWKKGNKKLAITIWVIIGIWFTSSIFYDEFRKPKQTPSAILLDIDDPFKAKPTGPPTNAKPEVQRVPAGGKLAATAAPNFRLQDMSGRNVMLSDYVGKVVVLDFWATWAPPCRDAIPGIEKLHNAYKDRGLVVLAVSLDQGGWDGVKAFISEYGITYIVLKGTDDIAELYQVRDIPMILVIDKTGKIMKRYLGHGFTNDIEADIKMAL